MFTLFWGGDTFAPKHTYEGQSIQQLLQTHFINAYKHLATRLEDLNVVIGFEVIVCTFVYIIYYFILFY